jgi:hypothetical protein
MDALSGPKYVIIFKNDNNEITLNKLFASGMGPLLSISIHHFYPHLMGTILLERFDSRLPDLLLG